MWKRINVYLSDKDIKLLWDIGGKDLISLAKNGLSETGVGIASLSSIEYNDNLLWNKSVWFRDVYDLLSLIYKDTQYIVENQKCSIWQGGCKDSNVERSVERKDNNNLIMNLSEKQLAVYNTRYKEYSSLFQLEKSRWTWDKMVESTYVFTPWYNRENRLLWANLAKLVIETDLDWTLYMSEDTYNNASVL